MINSNRNNWLNSINWQVDFYNRGNRRLRTDPEFFWPAIDNEMPSIRDEGKFPSRIFRKIAEKALHILGWRLTHSTEWLNSNPGMIRWLNSNAELLWESRTLLSDELSKLLFDATLVLCITGHQKFYFPRIDFDDLIEIVDSKPFQSTDLPMDYIGIPLKLLDIRFKGNSNTVPMNIVTSKEFVTLTNSYRQYLIRRNSFDISPVPGEVVLDCGACIGDTSTLFAGLVGMQGEVHLFDPIPLHARFCRLQASLNPSLAHVLHINELAVSNRTYVTNGNKSDSDKISPGGLAIDSFSSTSLDDYANSRLSRVDFIKMDIEGAEMDAIEGASKIIQEFKPRLAISAYHKPNDLWEIPFKLKSLNPSYNLYYGHHSPVRWESVLYAVQH